jgi:hypothetical protein
VILGIVAFCYPQFGTLAVIAAIALFTGIQIVCVGCVAIYVSKVIDEVRARPTYIVGEKLGLGFVTDLPSEQGQSGQRQRTVAATTGKESARSAR